MFTQLFLGVFLVCFAVATVTLSLSDIRSRRLPTRVIFAALTTQLVILLAWSGSSGEFARLWQAVLAATVCFVCALVFALFNPTGLGGGDVKLAALIGLALGWFGWLHVAAGMMLTVFVTGISALTQLLRGESAGRNASLPLAPIAFACAWIVIFATCLVAAGSAPNGF